MGGALTRDEIKVRATRDRWGAWWKQAGVEAVALALQGRRGGGLAWRPGPCISRELHGARGAWPGASGVAIRNLLSTILPNQS